jgi:hypothetical protein
MQMPDLTQTSAALIALAVFAVAYVFVIAEELAAMIFVNTLEERHVFVALRSTLVARGFSLRTVNHAKERQNA